MAYTGLHVNYLTPGALETIRKGRPQMVKTLDHHKDWRAIKQECGIQFLLGREWLDPVANLEPTPEEAAENLFGAMRPFMAMHHGVYDAWESPWNERYQRPWERLEDYGRATRRFCQLAHGIGVKVAVGNFSVANPEPEEMTLFLEGLAEADYLSLHEYWLPDNYNWGGWAGKWKRLLAAIPSQYQRPVLITECGIDGGLEDRRAHGWRSYDVAPTRYVEQLNEYRNSLDERVLGMTVFCCGTLDNAWSPFDVAGVAEVKTWLRDTHHTAPLPIPPTPEPPPPAPPQTPNDLYALREHISALDSLGKAMMGYGKEVQDRAAAIWHDYDLGNARPFQ